MDVDLDPGVTRGTTCGEGWGGDLNSNIKLAIEGEGGEGGDSNMYGKL